MKKWIVLPLALVGVLLATVAVTHHHRGFDIGATSWEMSRPHPKSDTVTEGNGSTGCDWQDLTILRWNLDQYVRDVNGKLARYTPVSFDPDATLPAGATFAGWHDGQRQLWTDPRSDKEGRLSIYIESPDGVERWPRIGMCI